MPVERINIGMSFVPSSQHAVRFEGRHELRGRSIQVELVNNRGAAVLNLVHREGTRIETPAFVLGSSRGEYVNPVLSPSDARDREKIVRLLEGHTIVIAAPHSLVLGSENAERFISVLRDLVRQRLPGVSFDFR